MSRRSRLITLVSLALIVLVIISYHSDPNREASFLEKAFLEVTGTLQKGLIATTTAIEDLWRDYLALVGLRAENRELKKALERARGNIAELHEQRLVNRRLTRMLKFTTDHDFESVGARIVAWNPGTWFNTLIVDRGSVDGLGQGMAVVNHQGVIGRIVEVAPHFAKVLLITDYNSSIDALIQRTRARGIFSGRSEKICHLRYIRKNEHVERGDLIVTSGMGGAFPRGIPLGTVTRVIKTGHDIFYSIDVAPSVDFDHLEETLVIIKEKQRDYDSAGPR